MVKAISLDFLLNPDISIPVFRKQSKGSAGLCSKTRLFSMQYQDTVLIEMLHLFWLEHRNECTILVYSAGQGFNFPYKVYLLIVLIIIQYIVYLLIEPSIIPYKVNILITYY